MGKRIVLLLGLATLAGAPQAFANDAERVIRGLLGGAGMIMEDAIGRQNTERYPDESQPRRLQDRQVRDEMAGARRAARQREPALEPDEVFVIQSRLNELGHPVGAPDGALGEETRRSIARYQSATGAEPTGYLTSDQAEALLEGSPSALQLVDGNRRLLAPSEILEFQRSLNELGYDSGQPDGVAGRATGRAISRFLNDRGHDPDTTDVRTAFEFALAAAGRPTMASADASASDVAGGGDGVQERLPRHLEVIDGAVVLRSGWTSEDRQKAVKEFLTALLLKSDPELGRNPDTLGSFVHLLGPGADAYGAPSAYGSGFDFKGSDEFEQRDMRDRFVANGLPKILAGLPELPLDLIDIWGVQFGTYDEAAQSFPVEFDHSFLRDLGNAGIPGRLNAELPFEMPSHVPMPPDEARAFIRTMAELKKPLDEESWRARWAYLPIRMRLSEVRKSGPARAELELSLVGMEMFVDAGLKMRLGSFPIPRGAVLAEPGSTETAAPTELPSLDAETGRRIAAALDPSLLQDAVFLAAAARERLAIERHARGYPSTVKPLLPLSVTKGNAELSMTDSERFEEWYTENAPLTPDKVRYPFGLMGGMNEGTLKVSLKDTLDDTWSSNPVFKLTDLDPAALDLASTTFPDAFGHVQISGSPDLAVIASLEPSPAWVETTIETGEQGSAGGSFAGHADFAIIDRRLENSAGKRVLMLKLKPLEVVRYLDSGERVRHVLDPDEQVEVSTLDIIGVSIGQPLSKAVEVAGEQLGDGVTVYEIASNDPSLRHGKILIKREGTHIYEQVAIFTEKEGPDQPVSGVTRHMDYAYHKATPEQIRASLLGKYGKPHTGEDEDTVWGGTASAKLYLAEHGDYNGCVLNPLRNFRPLTYFDERKTIATWEMEVSTLELEVPCGQVLSAFVSEGYFQMMLYDARRAIQVRNAAAQAAEAEKASQATEAPSAVKF